MPRQARIDAPGALHHVIVRGIERRDIFRSDRDRDDFLERLGCILLDTATPCWAWALMRNHLHLLVRTGGVPLAQVMRRLLTGYAQGFNRRYRRNGPLFQNRYKSILCQEDPYLLELTRYIHLNPLRAGAVPDLVGLDHYAYAGHAALMGRRKAAWQDTDGILKRFGRGRAAARKRYRAFVEKGIADGRRPELVGGGLVRSLGGWQAARSALRGAAHVKGDERILGDGDFVRQALVASDEALERRYRLAARGVDLQRLARHVAGLFGLEAHRLLAPGRYPAVVSARSLLCFWAVRELGISATHLAREIGLSQPAISVAVQRGEKLAREKRLRLDVEAPGD